MKKIIIITLVLILSANLAYSLEPLRISEIVTANQTADLKIDLLSSDGTLISNVYFEANRASGSTGTISILLQSSAWLNAEFNKSNLIKVVYGTDIISIQRLDVVMNKQSLYGSTISPDVINQTSDFTMKTLNLSGDLSVGGKVNLSKFIVSSKNITLTSNNTNIDLSLAENNFMILNITGYSDGNKDVINLLNPTEGQMLFIHYIDPNTNDLDRLDINNTATSLIGPHAARLIVYLNSKWHLIQIDAEV